MEIWIKSQVVNLLNEIYNSDILEKTVSVVEGKSLLNKEYSKGGLDRNRGFYGKFMLLDILIDNMARGRKISDKQIEKGATAVNVNIKMLKKWKIKMYIFPTIPHQIVSPKRLGFP